MAFPLSVSANGRYLVDQNGAPFFMVGDAAQSAAAALTYAQFQSYVDTRVAQGFNTINVNFIEHRYAPSPPADRDGNQPFTTPGVFATLNDAYFAGLEQKVAYAASKGVLVSLAFYAGGGGHDEGWYNELSSGANTQAVCYAFGQYLASGHGSFGGLKNYANVIWTWGADWLFTSDSEARDRLHKIAQGIKDAGATHLMTGDWGIPGTAQGLATIQDGFRTYMDLESVYAYENSGGIVATARAGYSYKPSSAGGDGRPLPALPAYMKETGYEGESNPSGTPVSVRSYGWNAILNGCTAGYWYGHRDVWDFAFATAGYGGAGLFPPYSPWTTSINSTGAQDMARLATLMGSIAWQRLVPSGTGAPFIGRVLIPGNDTSAGGAVAAAQAFDGTLLLAYVPSNASQSFTVDPRSMSGAARARWWDPTSGAFTSVGTIANTATQMVTTPGANSAGAHDWLLVLDITGPAPLSISPAMATVAPRGTTTFSASGGSATGYVWSLIVNASGGSISPAGLYTAGPTGSVTDTVKVTDSLGNTASATVTVTGAQQVPTVTSTAATGINTPSVTLNGSANPNGAATTAWFRFSTSNPGACNDTFGTRAPATGGTNLGSGAFAVSYALALTGLTANTTYYFCAIANNSVGTGLGSVLSFVTGSTSVVIGESNILSVDDWGNDNLLVAQPASLAQTATIQSLSFYVTTAAGKLRLGIYDATGPGGGPGVNKAETGEITAVVGWNTGNVIAPVSLPPGTYWLAYLPSDNTLAFRKEPNSSSSKFYSFSYGTFPATFSTAPNTAGSHWSFYATLTVTGSSGSPPTVATAAAASPNPATDTTGNLSVLGADDGGEANLIYTWSAIGTPPAPVIFSANGTNAAKNTVATFTNAGSYGLQVTIKDQSNLTVTSSVNVTVSQTMTLIAVAPASATVAIRGAVQFTASARDQFGQALLSQPTFAWTVSGGGTMSATGLFTAGGTAGGPFTVIASSGGKSGTASVTIGSNQPLIIGEPNVLLIDDYGNGNLLVAQPASLAQAATIQSLSFYVTTAAGKLRLGIYDATGPGGGPGAKQAETGEITTVAGWNTGTVIAPASLPPGTYWLAYLPSDNGLAFRKAPNSSTSKFYSFPYGTLPSTFSTAPNTSDSRWSLCGSLLP